MTSLQGWQYETLSEGHLLPDVQVSTWDGQNNENSCEKYILLYQYGVGPKFACNTTCMLLRTDSFKFWIVSSGTVYHPSQHLLVAWQMMEKGILLLILLYHTDHSGLMILKFGDYAGQSRCWSTSSCSSKED